MTSTTAQFDIPPEEERRIWQRVREQQFSLIFNTNRNSSAVAFSMALVLWAYVYFRLGNSWALAWGAAMHISQLTRSSWVARYFRDPPGSVADPHWVRGYITRLGINGALWGAAPLVMFDAQDMTGTALITVTVLAIHSGGQTWVAPVRGAVMAFCIPIVAQLCIALALHDNSALRMAAVLAFIYLSLSMRFALQHNQMLTDALYSKLVNAALNLRLSEQIGVVQRASAEKSRFLAAASHDLRQPMHAIALFSGALEHDLQGTPHHDNAKRSLGAVRALSESLDAMLDVSKLDAGVVEIIPAEVGIQKVFQRLNSVFSPQASEKGLQLRFRSTLLRVRADEHHLERMLANLVSNALKYTTQGGVLVAARRRSDGIALQVWDSGVGIAPEHQGRIFEEFYQLGNPGRDRSQGLGIGLAVVRRLSKVMEVAVEVKSRPGCGSLFSIVLPSTQILPDAEPLGPEFPASGLQLQLRLPARVLVLDDEDDILAAVRSVLGSRDVDVLSASTCEQALAHLRGGQDDRPVEAFVCDLRLAGGVNGLDFARSLGPIHGLEVPTILVTGETSRETMHEIRMAGMLALFKPVSSDRLLAALSATAERSVVRN